MKEREQVLNNIVDLRDLWCYLLKDSQSIDEKEYTKLLSKNPELEEAMAYLWKFSEEEQRQILADALEKNKRDQMAREDYVFDEGYEKGAKEGREEGEVKKEKELIISMLKNGASQEFVAQCTGLSIEEINKLKDK